MIKVCGHRVLVKPDFVKPKTDWGFEFVEGNEFRMEKNSTTIGTILSIGDTAWLDPGLGGAPWAKVGDRVYFAKYAGKTIKEGEEELFLMNDEDILAVIEEEAEDE